ncbi:MAG TPA: tyrosine-type recombinase/integrase [Methanocorpusculum sp.]|nr:tyrosine-type recombinase/integrase [Methanocorpusculum sp.]HJK62196.1 tyrosine-type recombinase/integrase [Methanocorpusculum sp.]HJK62659.1 tyrosine-type recombinase/integrase [Methanocorpusculum sp.]HJK63815.1 tyrosine-type recombinase/integrase [Methanocorpusculum sp.]HJK68612.1 tyrosine-type recombinase/integrase [Methanocorpusculum sp.]
MAIYDIDQFLASKRAIRTRQVIIWHFKAYFAWLYGSSSANDLTAASIRYITEPRNHFDTLQKYCTYMRDAADTLPNSQHQRLTYILQYLQWNEIELKSAQTNLLRGILPPNIEQHNDTPLTREMIAAILAHCDTILRAIILVQVSSGMRINEVIGLRHGDISIDTQIKAHIPAARMKSSQPHTYHISHEAWSAVEEWLKIRDTVTASGAKRTEKTLGRKKSWDPDQIFPITTTTLYRKFRTALKNAGYYEICQETSRLTISFHAFRRYAFTRMCDHMPEEIANSMIAHTTNRLNRSYLRPDLDQYYAKVEPYLNILAPAEYIELKGSTAEQVSDLAKAVASQVAKNQELEEELEEIRTALGLYMRAEKPDPDCS